MSAVLQNVGTVLCLWGCFWFMWDHRATAPGYILVLGLVALTLGWVFS